VNADRAAKRVVFAPDSFKGTATAADAARALADGWAGERPGDRLALAPMADGGEGTLEAFAAAGPGGRRLPVRVTGPDDRPVASEWLLLPDGTAVVELANTSGLTLLDTPRPLDAHTRGFGQAVRAALASGVRRLVLAIGGSSSSDGGAGVLAALGGRLLDAAGRPIADGARGLEALAAVDLSGMAPPPPDGAVVVTDVTSPLLGPAGAAAVFAPQKGASPGEVERIERALARLARALPAVDAAAPGTGAAGGAGFGLLAWGARLAPGSAAVADAIGLDAALAGSDLVVTGEGRFDSQSAAGKVPMHVRRAAERAGARALLVAGAIEADARAAGFADAVSLTELAGGAGPALADPLRWLREAGARLARAPR